MGIFPMKQPGMFGRKPYMTPGYGDSQQPGYGQPPADFGIDPSLMQTAPDPYAGQRPDAAPAPPGMFGKGRGLRDAFGYGLGALAQQLGGSNPYEDEIKSQREMDLLRQRAELENEFDDRRAARKMDVFGDAEGGHYSIDGQGNVKLVSPGRGPTPTTTMRDFEAYQGMTPEQRKLYDQGGFSGSNSQFGVDNRLRVKQAAPGKAPGAGGGGGVTPTARANAISQAEAAIARGADRNAVYARLAKMGIQ